MAKEQFFYTENRHHPQLLDQASQRSGLSRGQVFDDFLHMTICALSGGQMERKYVEIVKRHAAGKAGKRTCDCLAELFGRLIGSMEESRGEMKDVLGDLFVGAVTNGENGLFLTPEAVCS